VKCVYVCGARKSCVPVCVCAVAVWSSVCVQCAGVDATTSPGVRHGGDERAERCSGCKAQGGAVVAALGRQKARRCRQCCMCPGMSR